MRYQRLWTSALALAFVATAPTACGKKKKKSESAPAPTAVDTFVVGTSTDGRNMTVQYKSNIAGAKFKCATDVDGQAGQWSDCPAEGSVIPTEAGRKYVFKVKAIGPDGVEDAEPITYSFTAQGQGGGQEGPAVEPPAQTSAVIANKAEVGAIYTKRSLKLKLSVEGAALDAVRLECKRENESTFSLCGSGGTYDGFGELIDGAEYELAVRPVDRASGAVGNEDRIAFKVELRDIEIDNVTKLEAAKTGTHKLTFEQARRAGLRLSCSIDGSQPSDCTQGISVELDRLQPGSHALVVTAQTAQGAAAGETTVNFCAKECSAQGGNASAPLIKSMQIGSFYEYLIPEDMHVTEYATTKTYNDQLSFFRVMNDPFYLGNYACAREFDRKVSASSGRGKTWDYCHSTPRQDFYKWLTDFRLANNHLETATDFDLVNEFNHQRTMINVFDADYEYMKDRSRFEQLCLNKRGAIYRTRPIRFMDRGFWGENVKAEFYMCVAELVGPGPGLPSAVDEWWIGAFFITSDGLDLPKYECYAKDWAPHASNGYGTTEKGYYDYEYAQPEFCGTFKNPNLLEVLYMTKKPWREAHDFAADAQAQFLRNLREIVPILR